MASRVFPSRSFPGRVFPIDVWQGFEEKPERDGSWAAAVPSAFRVTVRIIPGERASLVPVQLSAMAAAKPGYHAENSK